MTTPKNPLKKEYNLGQLELDYYQHFLLSRLYENFNTIYFKGGSCLQKCYGIKRFSDDLDFNYYDLKPDKSYHTLKMFLKKRSLIIIKLNMTSKEMASVLNIAPSSIKSARYRLKKKLNLDMNVDLEEFIRNID